MEIKVGEYVRTKNGHIGKVMDISHITGQSRKKYLIKWNTSKAYYITNITIIKNGKRIIDLIEIGDVGKFFMEDDEDNEDTNIFEIVGKTSDNKELCVLTSDYQIDCFPVENLRAILTHEQFEQNAYRLEE